MGKNRLLKAIAEIIALSMFFLVGMANVLLWMVIFQEIESIIIKLGAFLAVVSAWVIFAYWWVRFLPKIEPWLPAEPEDAARPKNEAPEVAPGSFSWDNVGQVIHFGPVEGYYYGDAPRTAYTRQTPAEVALVDHCLVLKMGENPDITTLPVALSSIFWIGVQPVEVMAAQAPIYQTAIFAYFIQGPEAPLDLPFNKIPEPGFGWRLYVFSVQALDMFAAALSQIGPLTLDTAHADRRLDHGPARVRQLRQDVYGHWSPVGKIELYLAPDRLLAGQTSILFTQLHRLSVIRRKGIHLNTSALLRVDFAGPDHQPQVLGFAMRRENAEAWANTLHQRTGAPVEMYSAARKKKAAS